jgi:hypothetical protein
MPGGALAELDKLDQRRQVPLLPMMAHHQKQNMRDHLLAVQEILEGLGKEDFAAVEKASLRIGSSEQMERMCNHMGAGAVYVWRTFITADGTYTSRKMPGAAERFARARWQSTAATRVQAEVVAPPSGSPPRAPARPCITDPAALRGSARSRTAAARSSAPGYQFSLK